MHLSYWKLAGYVEAFRKIPLTFSSFDAVLHWIAAKSLQFQGFLIKIVTLSYLLCVIRFS